MRNRALRVETLEDRNAPSDAALLLTIAQVITVPPPPVPPPPTPIVHVGDLILPDGLPHNTVTPPPTGGTDLIGGLLDAPIGTPLK